MTLFAVACGTDTDTVNLPASESPASQNIDEDGGTVNVGAESDSQPVSASGGLNPECVQLVLGREVTDFTDITEAERTRVFAECSGSGERGSNRVAAGFDQSCIDGVTGEAGKVFGDLTPEQRQTVFAECGGASRIPFGGLTTGGIRPGGTFTPGDFGSFQIDSECIEDALGAPLDESGGLAELTPEQRELISECLPSPAQGTTSGSLSIPGGTAGGAGQLFESECAEGVLGEAAGDPSQLTQAQLQSVLFECGASLRGERNGDRARSGSSQASPAN